MDWITDIAFAWLSTAKWVAGFTIAFAILSRLMPCNPGMYWWRNVRGFVTDLIYWFIVPLFLGQARVLLLGAGIVALYGGAEPDLLPVHDWPLWVQCLIILLLQDVMLYWIHRGFHSRLAWKFHAVHHSPKTLDWMSTMRTHPINYILEFTVADVVVLLLGFAPQAVLTLAATNTVYSAMVHANLNWTFGPFRYLLASPVFHRWHHTMEDAGLDKNFASTFPFLDWFFGTFFMPAGKLPEQFGIRDEAFPEDFLGQIVYPFRASTPPSAAVPAPQPATRRRSRRTA